MSLRVRTEIRGPYLAVYLFIRHVSDHKVSLARSVKGISIFISHRDEKNLEPRFREVAWK